MRRALFLIDGLWCTSDGPVTSEDDEPVVLDDRTRIWLLDGELHRENGPAAIYPDGQQEWYRHGKRHRDGGPAIVGAGFEAWYRDGLRHRLDGPAVNVHAPDRFWVLGRRIDFDFVAWLTELGFGDADDETKLAMLRMRVSCLGE